MVTPSVLDRLPALVAGRLLLALFLPLWAPGALQAQPALVTDPDHGVVAFARDGWDVVTFPEELDRGGWYGLGGGPAVGGFLYAYDGDIQEWFRSHREAGVRPFLAPVTGMLALSVPVP